MEDKRSIAQTTDPRAETVGKDWSPFFCWIRVVHMGTSTPRTAVVEVVPPEIDIKSGDRPPPGVGSRLHKQGPNYAAQNPVVWFAPEAYFGREDADTTFEYGPAFECESEALEWITCPKGVAWDKGALNRMLMIVFVNKKFKEPGVES